MVVRLSQKQGITIWPNPFHSSITVSITSDRETTLDINLVDVSGKTIRNTKQAVSRGISQVTLGDLEQLPAGVYLLEINDKKAGTIYQKIIKNNY